jgi:hypothetical protein
MVNSRVWSTCKAPWQENPELSANLCLGVAKHNSRHRPPRENRSFTMLLSRHTPPKSKNASALTVNPAKTCQPIGAMYAALGHPRLPAPQPRLPGLLRLPPQCADPPLQGAGGGRHQRLHRRRLGFRRPGQPGAGHRQHLHRLRSRGDRRAHHLPVGNHRRRHPPDLRQGQGRRQDSRRQSSSSTPTRPATWAPT